jgi:hypothetical protein
VLYFEVEFNLIEIGSIHESDGWAYGALSSTSPAYFPLKGGYYKGKAEFEMKLMLAQYTYPQLSPSALIDFVNLQKDNIEQTIAYLRRYGLFSLDDLKTEGLPKKIQSYCDDSHKNDSAPFALHLESFWRWRDMFEEQLILTRAAKDKATAEAILSAPDKFDYDSEIVANLWKGDFFRFARDNYRALVLSRLTTVQFWAREKGEFLVPTIVSYGVLDALSVFLSEHLQRDAAFGECENPQCKKLFSVTRKTKRFCSGRCQSLIKVHRSREKTRASRRPK